MTCKLIRRDSVTVTRIRLKFEGRVKCECGRTSTVNWCHLNSWTPCFGCGRIYRLFTAVMVEQPDGWVVGTKDEGGAE